MIALLSYALIHAELEYPCSVFDDIEALYVRHFSDVFVYRTTDEDSSL